MPCRYIVVASRGKHWLKALREGKGGRVLVETDEDRALRRMRAMKKRHKNMSVGMMTKCGVR